MRIAVLLTSGLLLVASVASADNCPTCGGGYGGGQLAGFGGGGGCGNAYGNCDFASSLWAGYCSEPTWCGGCGGGCGKMGGLFGNRGNTCGGNCACCSGCNTWWYGYGAGPCGFARKKGACGCGGCGGGGYGAGLECCGGSSGWMDGLRHRFAGRGWQQGMMVGGDCGCGYAGGCATGCASGCAGGMGNGGYASEMVGAGSAEGAAQPSQPLPGAEVDSWQGSSFDYSNDALESPSAESGPFYESPPALLPESQRGAAGGEELPAADPELNDA